MNGYNMSNADDNDDDNFTWTPPTEAELKVLQAKRERNNKISNIMGKYLLQGYKMLATTCDICDCVLLENKQKKIYCLACNEVDDDNKKDDPAVSEHAARRTVEENLHRNASVEEDNFHAESHPLDEATNLISHPPPPRPAVTSSFSVDLTGTFNVLTEQLGSSTDLLKSSTNILERQQIVRLIQEIVQALSAIRQYHKK